jgi:hypothetical protein
LFGSHPAQNLAGIAGDSVFVIGERDPYIPPRRKTGLLQAIENCVRGAHVIKLNAGHFKTLMLSGRHQRKMLGVAAARRMWRLPLPWTRAETADHSSSAAALP